MANFIDSVSYNIPPNNWQNANHNIRNENLTDNIRNEDPGVRRKAPSLPKRITNKIRGFARIVFAELSTPVIRINYENFPPLTSIDNQIEIENGGVTYKKRKDVTEVIKDDLRTGQSPENVIDRFVSQGYVEQDIRAIINELSKLLFLLDNSSHPPAEGFVFAAEQADQRHRGVSHDVSLPLCCQFLADEERNPSTGQTLLGLIIDSLPKEQVILGEENIDYPGLDVSDVWREESEFHPPYKSIYNNEGILESLEETLEEVMEDTQLIGALIISSTGALALKKLNNGQIEVLDTKGDSQIAGRNGAYVFRCSAIENAREFFRKKICKMKRRDRLEAGRVILEIWPVQKSSWYSRSINPTLYDY